MTRLGRWLAASLVSTIALVGTPLAATAATPTAATPTTAAPDTTTGSAPVTLTNGLKLTLTSMSPREVTANTTSIAVSGTVTNISGRRIDNVKVRLQLGAPVTTSAQLAAALNGTAPNDVADTPYETETAVLQPGQTANISVTAGLQGAGSLNVTQAGVYPMLVNVQGQPAYGGQARLAAANLLLPVLAPPSGAAPNPPSSPTRVSLLWPLVDDQPRVVGQAGNGEEILSSDALATSLAPGGRLFNLVQAASQAMAGSAPLGDAMCFAIDPDLLATVKGMISGYLVRTASGATVAGTGGPTAGYWLNTLSQLTSGQCVLPLPEADADLVSLSRAGAVNLARLALADASEVSAVLPHADLLPGVVWPVDGAIDNATAIDLANLGVHTVLLQQNAVSPAGASGVATVTGTTAATAPRAVLIDQTVSTALTDSANESNVDASAVSAQNGIAAWTFRTVFGAESGQAGQTELIAPPRRWNASEEELQAFLAAVANSLSSHFASAVGLASLTNQAASGPSVRLAYPAAAQNAEIPGAVTDAVVADDAAQQDVQAAMNTDHADRSVTPSDLIDPLRAGLLRAVSSAWRGQDGGGAQDMLDTVTGRYAAMTDEVTVVPAAQTYSLGSNNSRLPVVVTNSLRVDITVRVNLAGQSGLAPSAAEQVIPAGSSATLFLPVKMSRSGRFSVEVSVTTPGGTPLGDSARFEVVSGAFGTVILIITVAAFGALVLLAGRRIYRRLRSARGISVTEPADLPSVPGETAVPNVPHLPTSPPLSQRQEPVEH